MSNARIKPKSKANSSKPGLPRSMPPGLQQHLKKSISQEEENCCKSDLDDITYPNTSSHSQEKDLSRRDSPTTANRLLIQRGDLEVLSKELSQWIQQLVPEADAFIDNTIDEEADACDAFFNNLASGSVICQLLKVIAPECKMKFRKSAKRGSFFARENFVVFARAAKEIGVPEISLFEASDVISRKNDQLVANCLLHLSRIAYQRGLPAPAIVHIEKEVDAEMEKNGDEVDSPRSGVACLRDANGSPPAFARFVAKQGDQIDEAVQTLIQRRNIGISIVRKKNGVYNVGGERRNIYVRLVQSVAMVRVGGGWESLHSYIARRFKMPPPSALASNIYPHLSARKQVNLPP